MRRVLTFLFCLFFAGVAMAQANYAVSAIPKDLLPYASAVVRNQNVVTEIKDPANTIYRIKKAVTILNENGDDIARIVLFYDKSRAIKSIKGATYDEFGKLVSKFSEKNFNDEGTSDGFSLYQDSRVKHYLPTIGSYPYTIEYEVEMRFKQTLVLPDWNPVNEPGVAVEKSTYSFACKPDFKIAYKEINLPAKMVSGTTKEGLVTYNWEVNNLKAYRNEPYSPIAENYFARLKIAPKTFTYGGIPGSSSNWNELGKWTYDNLLKGRRDLLPATKDMVKQLTANITDPKEKAKKIYEYMQGKTRYISVQIGIGGFQPYPASEVDRLNYGDCKGLVNYTQALLEAANIPSWYCVVEAGAGKKISMLPDFATMDQGNHIILCLPFKNDTTFLECTSQKIPFGFLSDFTDDRTVLACTPEGGKLLHTPKYTAAQNLQTRTAQFNITDSGDLIGEVTAIYKGTQYDNPEELVDEPFTEQVKTLRKQYNYLPNLEIEKLSLKQDKLQMPVSTETIKLSAGEFASTDNGKIYFSLNPLNRSRSLKGVRNRINPVYINRGYTDEDEITYILPKGYHPETEGWHVNIDEPFGKYHASVKIADGKLTYKRSLKVIDGTYGKETYSKLVEFYQKIADNDAYTVSLVKN
ncbi:DUF3857 domain-containing protein [Mucilaginibacter achroorhodeus]|uniref:DUF3857 domain-containing protein n=1 Tax=Mucilaginibacter achroorhodeus TaxID=2599294 RepID=A0A563U680_9SPHI|nr:DUF3857 domain-containing transglutaminase family protein [Mucilaginibacter achroorhodeus]TWR26866.1 DUF3857 domain-containing protein [Mucilaginibacter achroorhodeus]